MGNHPIAELGELTLLLTLIVGTYAGAAGAIGARQRSRKIITSAIYGTYATAALMTLASALIFFSILANDYGIKYVQRYSDAAMPWYYKITAYWGGLDGSMMFWAWLLAGFAALAVYTNRERHRELTPWVIVIFMVILDFFLLLLIFEKRPFDTFLVEAPAAGRGMPPLLQNAYMAIHPPALYIGLVSAAVPYAFAMAALITGNLDDNWLRSVRRWVLLSWFFLSFGLVLGMLWAYEVLGWGGYWGWDPVENAGALAWFTWTAFLHSVMVQERRGMLKVWNVFLVIVSFVLTLVATFLTRSGIVQSVHAFGSDPVLKWSFLGFIGFVLVLSLGFLIHRLPLLRSRGQLDSWLSREFAFLVNNWILLAAALFILVATLFPTLSEWITHSRITLATPFYTQWMSPIGLVLLFLTGVGPLIAWRHASTQNLREQFLFPGLTAVVVVAALAFVPGVSAGSAIFRDNWELPVSLVCFGLCAFVTATIAQEFYRGARVRQHHTGLDIFTSGIGLVSRNKRRYGGYLVHLGIVLMFFGFAGGSYKKETEVTLVKGQQTQLDRFTIRFNSLTETASVEKRELLANMSIIVGGKEVAVATPGKWYFPHHEEEPISHVEINRGIKEDLYMVMNNFDPQTGVVAFKIILNRLVNWIWAGFLLLAFGTGIAFTPERAYQLAEQTARERSKAASGGTIASLFFLIFFGFASLARADGMAPAELTPSHTSGDTVKATPRTPDESELFKKIVCTCGTCQRELLSECTCGFAAQSRSKISRMLEDGMTKQQILDKIGEAAWAVPRNNWMAAAMAYGAVLIGAGVLFITARRIKKNPNSSAAGPAVAAAAPPPKHEGDDDYHSRLDDELDDLD